MLLNLSRPPIKLATPTDPVIEAIINLLPDYSTGGALHAVYVNKLQSALPGNYSQLFGTGRAFRSVFYPSWQPHQYLSIAGETGLDDDWWRRFSIAVLCQGIQEMGSSIRGQMMASNINADVAAFNATLRTRSARAYARMLAVAYGPLSTLLRQTNPGTAKQQFREALLANVLNRVLWFQVGMWTSPDWEMFNQYAKYIALGATDGEVDTLIGDLIAAGLPIPAHVTQAGWRSFAEEFRDKPNLDVNDIRNAASGPITTSTWFPGGPMPVQMPNGNCFEFTANSQPGRIYRQLPGGCCFTGDTEVLNGDGEPVRLRLMKAGDRVMTRDGAATVAFVPRPLRSGRTLFSFTGGGPVFTGTHPFLNGAIVASGERQPLLLALEPAKLEWAVPTLSESGVGAIEVGSVLISRDAGPDQKPQRMPVTGIEEIQADAGDGVLYDLNLVTKTGTRQEFWAGQGGRFYLVSPEFPVLDQAPGAAIAVVSALEGLFGANGLGSGGWPADVIDLLNKFGAGVFHGALMEALANTPSFGAKAPSASVYQRINELYSVLDTSSPEMAAVVSSLFDTLMSTVGQWLASLVATGWRRGNLLGGDVLAVTVFDMVMSPDSPIPVDSLIRLDVKISGYTESESTCMWDRCGRANTHFHHYFDQLVDLDLSGEDRPIKLSFQAYVHEAPIAVLSAEVSGIVVDATHQLQSVVLRDATGKGVGTLRFDTRKLGRDAASEELGESGRWTEEASNAYANALGAAMVQPILWKLRELGSKPG